MIRSFEQTKKCQEMIIFVGYTQKKGSIIEVIQVKVVGARSEPDEKVKVKNSKILTIMKDYISLENFLE